MILRVTLPHRHDLPQLWTALGLTGMGAELGVAAGAYSEAILRRWPGTLLSIDAWAGDRGHDQAQAEAVRRRLAPWGERSRILPVSFEEAMDLIPDGSLDWCYIDGYAHTGNLDGETFRAWWRKVRVGGLIGGHDYSRQWPRNWRAVNRFVEEIGSEEILVTGDQPSSWMIRRTTREPSAHRPPAPRGMTF